MLLITFGSQFISPGRFEHVDCLINNPLLEFSDKSRGPISPKQTLQFAISILHIGQP